MDGRRLAPASEITAAFVVAATGCLSAPIEPAIAGLHDFAGDTLFTNRFPKEGFDFTRQAGGRRRHGLVGRAVDPGDRRGRPATLFVLQRSAAYTLPSPNRPLGRTELDGLKAEYPRDPEAQWASPLGTARFGAVSFLGGGELTNILDTPWEEQLAQLDDAGASPAASRGPTSFFDLEANDAATQPLRARGSGAS